MQFIVCCTILVIPNHVYELYQRAGKGTKDLPKKVKLSKVLNALSWCGVQLYDAIF